MSDLQTSSSLAAYRPRLHAFAVVFVVVTFLLLILGGTVTSRRVGLSVPDWPTSYHYNMFLFPISLWQGGVFYEHTHRLLGSLVGVLGIVMAAWLWVTQAHRPWLRWLGVGTLGLVIVQGVMGGLRVTEISTSLAVLHGITGQLFLCATVFIAAATSKFWIKHNADASTQTHAASGLRTLSLALLGVMLVQLILGATMRHTDSGLAIPTFPDSYGRLIPPLNQADIEQAMNKMPMEDSPSQYFTPAQVGVHFAHRVWAIAVLLTAGWLIVRTSLAFPAEASLRGPVVTLACLLIAQIALGVLVIWTGRHPEIATAHQATGAATLATAWLLSLRIHRLSGSARHLNQHAPDSAHAAAPSFLQGAKA